MVRLIFSISEKWFFPRKANVKDTQREKALSNITLVATESMNTDIWVVSTSNQLFIRGSHFILPILIFCSFDRKCSVFNHSTFNWKKILLKKVFVFKKICFKAKLLKTFKLSVITKYADLSNGGLFWESLVLFYRRTYICSFCCF